MVEAGPGAPRTRIAPELLIALGCVAVVVLLSLPAWLGMVVGVGLALGSLAVGVVAGLGYHVVLHRALAPAPPRWWWNPTAFHAGLGALARRQITPWFRVGAAGFVGSLLGCAVFLSAALRL